VIHLGCPGVGGSLGQCALCGESFVVEVCIGKPVKSFDYNGQTMYLHEGCQKYSVDGVVDCLALPEKSPLRKAFVALNAAMDLIAKLRKEKNESDHHMPD